MKRIAVIVLSWVILACSFGQAEEYSSYPVFFSQEKLQEDFLQFRNILEDTHPALYDYTSKEILDSLFDHNLARIDTALDFNRFLVLMTEVIAQVGCGHSSMWIPGDFWDVAPDGLFPLKMHIHEDRGFVTGFHGEEDLLPLESEILTIQGEALPKIVNRLVELSSADGLNQAYRMAKVNQYFPLKYAVAFGLQDSFQVTYRLPDESGIRENTLKLDQSVVEENILKLDQPGIFELTLNPVSKAQVDQSRFGDPELSFQEMEQGQVGLLTINSFGYYGQVDWFKAFIDSVFMVCMEKQIDHLILDLRGNSGGDPFCASYLWAYLQPESLPYFEDHYGRYDTLANAVPQPANHFRGRLYTLIDGRCFSTTGHFLGLLDYHDVGIFVGSESGATYTCTGNATYPALDHTGIMVGTARVMRYTAAVQDMDPRRGIVPDHPVEITPGDLIQGRDVVLDLALSLISRQ